jgi:ABC-type dipeptide/oligopeptide/nickel transport system permease subunit
MPAPIWVPTRHGVMPMSACACCARSDWRSSSGGRWRRQRRPPLARAEACSHLAAWRRIWRNESDFACNAVLAALGLLLLFALPLLILAADYHVLGTDKVGQDVLYQVLKSVRTALVIGLVTTLVMLPLSIFLGVLAGYFRGWVDDLIQYLYTTLSSIPGVLLIAAAVLMMQVLIDTHPEWFATAAERADMRPAGAVLHPRGDQLDRSVSLVARRDAEAP